MKKSTLALIIISSTASASVMSAEIYNKDGNKLNLSGYIIGEHAFSENALANGDTSFMRFGFSGETHISDNLSGYGLWQVQVQGNLPEGSTTPNSRTRYAFAGLRSATYGSFDYGRNTGILYDAASFTDMQPDFDGLTYFSDQFMFKRGSGMATYRNSNFFGLVDNLKLGLQYQGANEGGSPLTQNGNSYGASLTYDFGYDISLAGAFFNAQRTDAQNTTRGIMGNGKNAEGYSGALRYMGKSLYMAVMYTQAYNASRFGSLAAPAFGFANKSQAVEAYAGYTFDDGLTTFIAYNQNIGKDLGTDSKGNHYKNQDLVKFIDFGFIYNLNKNMATYMDYKVSLLNDDTFTKYTGIITDNITAVGVKYTF